MNPLDMLTHHPFWGALTLAVLVWYSTVTVYVAVRGAYDIKHMLANLAARKNAAEATSPDEGGKSGE